VLDEEQDVVEDESGLAQNIGGAASADDWPLVQVQAILLH
jgi:hypothetical protein